MEEKKFSKKEIGKNGEDVACKFLVKQGFSIVTRNYWKKWGEIDVVAKKDSLLHFVEVKTVSRENLEGRQGSVSYETLDNYRPEDNVHTWKLERLRRVIQTYLLAECREGESWQFDIITVFLDMDNKKARVHLMNDIVL